MNNLNLNNMFSSNKLMEQLFQRVDNAVWDLSTGRVGVVSDDGIATLDVIHGVPGADGEKVEDKYRVNLNIIDQFGISVPAYAQSTNVKDVKNGDLIFPSKGSAPGWVIGREEVVMGGEVVTTFKLVQTNGFTMPWTPPKVQMLGSATGDVKVLRSLLNMLPGGQSDLGGIQNGLQMAMMMGGGELGSAQLDKIMPFLLMGGMGGSLGGGNNLMSMMMLMNFMGGNNNGGRLANPFSNRN